MRIRGLLLLAPLLLATAAPRAQDKPEKADKAPAPVDLCDALLANDSTRRDRAAFELNLLSEARADELGREILSRPTLETRRLLGCVGNATGNFAVIAAMVCLESSKTEVRNCALEAMVDSPLEAVRKSGERHLKDKRRATLKAMLLDKESLRPLCAGLDEIDPRQMPLERSLRLTIITDRYFGAPGFAGLLRGLGELMAGEEDAAEPTAPDSPDPEKPIGGPARLEKKTAKADARSEAERLRRQAAALFQTIWVHSPGALFNYVPNAPIAQRRAAIARLGARLDEMENREIEFGNHKVKGVRFGDFLLEACVDQVDGEAMSAALMRLQWWRGQAAALQGEEYGKAVEGLKAMGRRERAALMREIKAWWAGYRSETEPR